MKIVRRIVIGCICVVMIEAAAIYGLWHDEIISVMSIQRNVPAKQKNKSGSVY